MQLCFLIENKELYMEQALVEYNEIPIFFVCRNLEDYYIALCTDIDETRYIVVKTSLLDLARMLHGKMTMQDIIIRQKSFWNIQTGESVHDDVVIEKDMKLIDKSELPYENAFYRVATEEIQEYVKKIDNRLYSGSYEVIKNCVFDKNEYGEILQQEWVNIVGNYQISIQEYVQIFENVLKTRFCYISKCVDEYKKEGFKIKASKTNNFSNDKKTNQTMVVKKIDSLVA